jgi:hypothetical protein
MAYPEPRRPARPPLSQRADKPRVGELLVAAGVVLLLNLLYYALFVAVVVGVGVLVYKAAT